MGSIVSNYIVVKFFIIYCKDKWIIAINGSMHPVQCLYIKMQLWQFVTGTGVQECWVTDGAGQTQTTEGYGGWGPRD